MNKLLQNIGLCAMLVLTVLGVQSCTGELLEKDAVQVTFRARIPGELHTRSFGSAEQINTLVVGVFDAQKDKELYRKTFAAGGALTEVSLSLAKNQTYNFVFWAYADSEEECYDIRDLKAIKMEGIGGLTTLSEAEGMDAFYATAEGITISGSSSYPVELVRPLAQINVGTTGTPIETTIKVQSAPDTFHPFTKTVSGSAEYRWEFSSTGGETFSADGKEYKYLAMAYVFAPLDGEGTVSVELTLTEGDSSQKVELPTVEIQANQKSNILKHIL